MDIVWDEKFELGHERIDFEHRVFVNLIQTIDQEGKAGCDRERLLRLLEELRKYADFHFTSEENIMYDAGYPEREGHAREHARLLAHLSDISHAFYCGHEQVESVVGFLFEWFALHTTQRDKLLTSWLQR